MRKILHRLVASLLLFLGLIQGCSEEASESDVQATENKYVWDVPTEIHELAGRLKEISGLSSNEKGELLAIQDEKGMLYHLNARNGDILKEIKFRKQGDYEAVEWAFNKLWILRSDGNMYAFEVDGEDSDPVSKFEFDADHWYEWESLAYDPFTQSLLAITKTTQSGKKKSADDFKVFRYQVLRGNDKVELLFSVSHSSIEARLPKGVQLESKSLFLPSALAVEPTKGHFYILSSVNSLMLILDRNGKVLQLTQFKAKKIRQPEGICFLPDGTLVIASEGQSKKGVLALFSPI